LKGLAVANDMDIDQLEQGLAIGAVGFGVVAALAPGVFTKVYGIGDDPRLLTLTRLWGTRTTALGLLALTGSADSQRLATIATGMNAFDALVVARAGGIPARSRAMGALTSGAFAAAFAYVAAQRR
jgi:hypothetical protein